MQIMKNSFDDSASADDQSITGDLVFRVRDDDACLLLYETDLMIIIIYHLLYCTFTKHSYLSHVASEPLSS